jgi:hypothetical protein
MLRYIVNTLLHCFWLFPQPASIKERKPRVCGPEVRARNTKSRRGEAGWRCRVNMRTSFSGRYVS